MTEPDTMTDRERADRAGRGVVALYIAFCLLQALFYFGTVAFLLLLA